MGRASSNQINVVSNSLGGKLVNTEDRANGKTVIFDTATDKYIHVDLATIYAPISVLEDIETLLDAILA